MARGRRWSREDVEQWVERWWASGLTSERFVRNDSLPISARALRSHAERQFGEVLRELRELRALAVARGISWSRSPPATCHPANSPADPPPAVREVATEEPASSTAKAFIFDLDDFRADETEPSLAEHDTELGRETLCQVANFEPPSVSVTPDVVTKVDADCQVATAEAVPTDTGPFLFDVESW
jgi:hypothetical protein